MARRRIWINHIRGTLDSGIDDADLALTSTDGNPGCAGVDALVTSDVYAVATLDPLGVDGDPEQVIVTAGSSGVLTIGERGYGGTTARAHDAGTTIVFPVTAEDIGRSMIDTPLWGPDVIFQRHFAQYADGTPSGATLVDPQSSAIVVQRGGRAAITIPSDGSLDLRAVMFPVPLPSAFRLEAKIFHTAEDNNYFNSYLLVGEGGNGEYYGVGIDDDNQTIRSEWTTASSVGSNTQSPFWSERTNVFYQIITKNGTDDWDFAVSFDGTVGRVTQTGEAIDAMFADPVDEVGFGGECRHADANGLVVACEWIRVVDLT